MRGEDVPGDERFVYKYGSPPHARGRRRRSGHQDWPFGITPACAGKTKNAFNIDENNGDHPRMRGEDIKNIQKDVAKAGSPPHARGRPRKGKVNDLHRRITPACAGKTAQLTLK